MSDIKQCLVIILLVLCVLLVSGDMVDIEDTCGTVLRDRCPSLTKYVVGGTNSCAENSPWNAVLEIRTGRRRKREGSRITVLCGGTLVSSKHIVTAAHCVWGNRAQSRTCSEPHLSMNPEQCRKSGCPPECLRVRGEDLNIYLGITNIEEPSARPHRVKHILIHPGWDKTTALNNITNGHDLAILEMDEAVTFTADTWPICLPNPHSDGHLIEPRRTVNVAGFGVHRITNDQRRIYPEILQSTSLYITSTAECRSEAVWGITGDQICALGEKVSDSGTTDTCSGDSGSGLIASRHDGTNVLLGIVSFGESDCGVSGGRPGVYTNIMSHVSWMKGVMEAGASCTTIMGESCVFPFLFKGVIYTGCTSEHDPEDKLWCSTLVDSSGKHVENMDEWGHCSQGCIKHEAKSYLTSQLVLLPWSPCSVTCGNGIQTRQTEDCQSLNCIETKICSPKECPILYSTPAAQLWSDWGSWSQCTNTCGRGYRFRNRGCGTIIEAKSIPHVRSSLCKGPARQETSCTNKKCVEVGGGGRREWSSWGEFGLCSSTCNGGTKRRYRICLGIRGECLGAGSETQACGDTICRLEPSSGNDNMVTLLMGGWDGEWYLKNVTILTRNGKTCPSMNLPVILADHFSVIKDGKILTCGGRSSDQKTLCWWWNPAVKDDGWVNAPRMSGGRSYADALVTKGLVWVTGGWDGEVRHKTTEILRNQARNWTRGPELTISKYQHCGVTLNDGSVVITGGQEATIRGNSGALDIVERYYWRTGFIEKLPSLNQPRWTHACGSLTVQGKEAIIVVGGRITSGTGDALSSVEILVTGSSSWIFKREIPQPRLAPAMVVIANTPVITGGMYSNGPRDEVYPDTVLEYDVAMDLWKTVGRIKGRNHHTAVAISRTLLKQYC